jgi:hypothetical protein
MCYYTRRRISSQAGQGDAARPCVRDAVRRAVPCGPSPRADLHTPALMLWLNAPHDPFPGAGVGALFRPGIRRKHS